MEESIAGKYFARRGKVIPKKINTTIKIIKRLDLFVQLTLLWISTPNWFVFI